MKTKLIQAWAGIILLLSSTAVMQAQDLFKSGFTHLREVSGAVENSHDFWITMFPEEDLPSFGFKNQRELRSAVAGTPVPLFHSFRNQEGVTSVQPSGEYLIPLLVNEQVRAFLTVAYVEERFNVVSAGEMNLAIDAAPYLNSSFQTSKEGKIIWLRDLNQQADFIATIGADTEVSDPEFIPLFTAQRAAFTGAIKFSGLVEKLGEMPIQPN